MSWELFLINVVCWLAGFVVGICAKEVAARIDEQQQRIQAFGQTVKTMNGFAQLSAQQAHQIMLMNKEIAELRALTGKDNGEEAEVKGE